MQQSFQKNEQNLFEKEKEISILQEKLKQNQQIITEKEEKIQEFQQKFSNQLENQSSQQQEQLDSL